MIVVAQLPDGASKERTDAVLAKIHDVTAKVPGVEHVVTVSGISILDNRASLANAGVTFVVLDDWDARLKQTGQDQETIQRRINGGLQSIPEAFSFAVLPPPIQGVGNVGGFTMQVEILQRRFRLRPSAKSRQYRGRERQCAIRPRASRHDFSRRRAAILGRGRQNESGGARDHSSAATSAWTAT